MKPLIPLISIILLSVAAANEGQPTEPVVTQSVTASGLTKLHITSTEGKEIATYDLDLRTHHQPADGAITATI